MSKDPRFVIITPTPDTLINGRIGWNIDQYADGEVDLSDCGYFEKTMGDAIATAKDMAMDNDATFIVVVSKSGRTRTIDIPQVHSEVAA